MKDGADLPRPVLKGQACRICDRSSFGYAGSVAAIQKLCFRPALQNHLRCLCDRRIQTKPTFLGMRLIQGDNVKLALFAPIKDKNRQIHTVYRMLQVDLRLCKYHGWRPVAFLAWGAYAKCA